MIDPMFFWSAHDLAPINCASGCAANYAAGIHASLRAQHCGVALWPGAAVEQLEMDWEAREAEADREWQEALDHAEAEAAKYERLADDLQKRIDALEAEAAG